MARKIIRRPRAKQDIIEQALFIARDNPSAAERFINESRKAFTALAEMPFIGGRRDYKIPELKGLRMWPVPNFEKHLIFYFPRDEHIEVIRVLHASRDIEAILKEYPE